VRLAAFHPPGRDGPARAVEFDLVTTGAAGDGGEGTEPHFADLAAPLVGSLGGGDAEPQTIAVHARLGAPDCFCR